jgi:hypothetical protein
LRGFEKGAEIELRTYGEQPALTIDIFESIPVYRLSDQTTTLVYLKVEDENLRRVSSASDIAIFAKLYRW